MVCMSTVANDSSAQTIPATVSANGSDYFMYLNWSSFNGNLGCQSCVSGGCVCHWTNRQTWYFYSGCGSFTGCCFQSSDAATHSQQGGYSSAGGTYTFTVGPDVSQRYAMRYRQQRSQDCFNSCDEWRWTNCFNPSTANTKPPVNLQAQNEVEYTSIHITWDKGTSDIPDGQLRYRVYKNGTLVHTTTQSSVRQWTDTGMNPGETHTYRVRAVYTPTNKESTLSISPVTTGSTRPVTLNASDFEFTNRTRLQWPNVSSFADEIRVYRGTEEIAIVSSNATSYNDYDGIPGVVYSYSIEPLAPNGSPYPRYYDNGSRKPNGRISGEVKTPFNAGVEGVIVTATASLHGSDTSYVDTTDASGYYDIRHIYYHEEAQYTVTPSKSGHGFNPGNTQRMLDVLSPVVSSVNFTDTTVFSVLGRAHFPVLIPGDTCWIQGAEVLVNGQPTSVFTNFQGRYAIGIQQIGNHTISLRYHDHVFSPASYTLNMNQNHFNRNFIDQEVDTVLVTVKGGCNNIIADSTRFQIRSTDIAGCFNRTYTTDASGVAAVILPKRDFRVEVLGVYKNGNNDQNVLSQFEDILIDITVRDSVPSEADSTVMVAVAPRVDFIYRAGVEIIVNDLPDPVCGPGGSLLTVMEQGVNEMLEVWVMETHTYPELQTCPVEGGTVTFVDNVSDRDPVTLDLVDGRVFYEVVPGLPNIAGGGANPFQKLMEIQANVGFFPTVVEPVWVMVKGHRPREQTFVTRTPELPFFILHDPPGDASYSYLEEGQSYSYAYSNSVQVGGGAGIYWDIHIGAGIPIPFTGVVIGATTHIEGSAIAGRDNTDREAAVTTWTANQQFSTSGNDDLIGSDGDVYVGASYNMIYALTDEIDYDPNTCSIVQDISLVWGADDIATTYIYTESHIVNTLLPQLYLLQSLVNGDSVQLIQTYIDVWEQVVAKNALNKQQAQQVQNISFSAGAPYESSTTFENETSMEIEYNIFIETEVAIGVGVGDGGNFANTEFGVKANFKWNTSRTETTTVGSSKTVGFHLEDDDPGDFFSVDIKKDRVYGTPVFTVVAGTSSCPFEPGTQPRDEPQMTLDNYLVTNVPSNGQGVFVANLANLSQSGETREYSVRSVNESNLDGAIIKLGGQIITTTPVTYSIPALQSIPVLLTVERGPLANTYENLQVVMYPPCDEALADTVTFTVNFQSVCSQVQLFQPDNNWVANQASNNSLYVVLTGYNMNDPNLIDVRIQYRRQGQGWQNAAIIPASQLTQQYYNFNFDITNIPDGPYEIRAAANCGAQIGYNYSPVRSGIIDRQSITLFGLPTPADGVLNLDEVISVSFNEDIDCDLLYDPVNVTLTRNDNGQNVPVSFVCSGNTILINTTPPSLLDSLENVMLTASVSNLSDFNGNELQQPVTWEFVVNRSPVFWQPSFVDAASEVGQTSQIQAGLRNVSNATQDFLITSLPTWLTTAQTSGQVVSGGTLPISFTVGNSLDVGIYKDTVTALVNGVEQYLRIRLQVNSVAPDWTVNPADFQYSMSITSQFSITDLDAPLSSDTRDMVAAFVDGQCRGVANIAYVPNLNVYAAFLTVYGNQPFGEELEFRFWDAYPGTEYQAVETMMLIPDQSVGQAVAPFILHPGGVFQNIALDAGWNWFSLSVRPSDMVIDNVLATVIAGEGDVVKSQDVYAQYSTAAGWEGPLTTFSNDRSYQIRLSAPSTLRFLGQPLPESHEVPVSAGWNWLGYPRLSINPVAPMLDSYAATDGDLVKNDTQFATFDSGTGSWVGSMEVFQPGRGYKLKSANPGMVDFRSAAASIPMECENFQLFENNMTVTAKLTNNGTDIFDSHFIVTVVLNDSCRAWAQPEFIPELNAYRLFFTVPGFAANTGQNLSFEVENLDNGAVFVPEYTPITFSADAVAGDLGQAFVLNINTVGIEENLNVAGHWLGQNQPNPFDGQTLIPYSLGEQTHVSLEVFDIVGNRVMTLFSGSQAAGNHNVSFDSDRLAGGMYLYVLTTPQGRQTKRMVVSK